MSGSPPDGYALRDGLPQPDEYLALRERSGLTPKRPDQARGIAEGTWTAVHVVDLESREAVGMGRVIGDGGWYFHVVDMAVLPQHQRQGLGDAILSELVARIRRDAPPGAYVNLFADPPGRGLYERHGFTDAAPGQMGMSLLLD